MKRFFLVTVLSIIISGLAFIITQSTVHADEGEAVKIALYFSFVVFSLMMIVNVLWELGLKNIIERNNRNKIIVVFYCLWSFLHLTILFASFFQPYHLSGFWPFEGVHSLNISRYDFSEFAVYFILPTAVLLIYWFISGHHKQPNTEKK